VVMRQNANYMIHNAWTIAMGNAADMRQAAEALDKVTEPIIGVYKAQTGNKISRAKIIELMDAETWMTADEALEYGFVDEVRGKADTIKSTAKGRMLVNGKIFNIARYNYKHVPNFPVAKAEAPPAAIPPTPPAPSTPISKDKPKNKPKGKMTLEELQQVDPDLVASIRSDASKAEQTRLAALNAMMAPGLEAIIAKAITDGTQPASIAMECFNIVRENNESQARVNQLKRDAAPAGNVPAGDAPIIKPPKAGEKPKASSLIAAAFKNDSRQKQREKGNGRLMFSN
jgi:ATP-dependent Clp protease, protease subunit